MRIEQTTNPDHNTLTFERLWERQGLLKRPSAAWIALFAGLTVIAFAIDKPILGFLAAVLACIQAALVLTFGYRRRKSIDRAIEMTYMPTEPSLMVVEISPEWFGVELPMVQVRWRWDCVEAIEEDEQFIMVFVGGGMVLLNKEQMSSPHEARTFAELADEYRAAVEPE